MSYCTLYYHIVLSTYRRQQTINIANERKLYAYIYGILKNMEATVLRIGGMPDHVHILVALPAKHSLSYVVQQLKVSSSNWLKGNNDFPYWDHWSNGYAAFSIGRTELDMVRNYIINQKEHHVSEQFADECRRLIIEYGGTIDEKYFLKDD